MKEGYDIHYYMASSASEQYAANSVHVLIGYPSGQDGAILPARWSDTARFVPANKISPKFKRVHESFLSLILLSAKVKGFFLRFLCLYGTRKSVNENENKGNRNVDKF